MITADGLAKSFGEIQAVKEVSFTAKNGEATGLLGPNGSGKSTTLRVIYGLLKQDTGTASIDGVDILAETRKAQGMMGVLTDTHALYVRLTAREHIHYFGRLHGVDENKLENNTDELLRLLDMQSIADRRVEGFSQGEKTKVCLARALIHDPPNVLLDEPTNGLDVMTTKSVRDLISELKNRNICVTFSSHMMHEVARLCDHIVIISEGTVVTAGSAEEIRAAAKEDNLEEAFIKLVEAVID
ncbi:MAG: ABC transporter [Gammaproteobacteria bacterium]|jgi:sodium transport system ATP-binding protein|nr:ABC transporter [Gammaproteobacteria bacterium]